MTRSASRPQCPLRALWLGRAAYAPVHDLQHQLHEARKAGQIGDTVLFLEHEPTITLGRGATAEQLLTSEAALAEAGIALVSTGRGGAITIHAPGQLVCYPILDLHDRMDVRRYVQDLNRVMMTVAASYGVQSGVIEKYIGLWADAEQPGSWLGASHAQTPVKIGAIGVRISRWVTMHGFALNLSTDLALFRLIIPCGITEFGVGSIAALTGVTHSVKGAAERALPLLAETFGHGAGTPELEVTSVAELTAELASARSDAPQHSPA